MYVSFTVSASAKEDTKKKFFGKVVANVLMYNVVGKVFSQYPLSNAQMACEETYTTLQKNIL